MRDFEELAAHLEEFIDSYYNRQRLHSALGYRTPEEFERDAAAAAPDGGPHAAPTMTYFAAPLQPPNEDDAAQAPGVSGP